MTKQKYLRKIFEWIIIYCYNIAGGDAPYFPLPELDHIQLKFNTRVQDLKGILDLNLK